MAATKPNLTEDLAAVWELGDLGDDDFKRLLEEVSKASPSPRLDVLCDAITQEHQNLVHALVRLAINFGVDEAQLRDLLNNYIGSTTKLPPSEFTDDQFKRAVDRAIRLLKSRPLLLHLSSTRLRLSHERTFLAAGMVTDLRPIVDQYVQTDYPQVVAVLRRHNLSLTTLDSDGNTHENFMVLDDEDIESLIATLERARTLVPALKQLSAQADLIDLSLS